MDNKEDLIYIRNNIHIEAKQLVKDLKNKYTYKMIKHAKSYIYRINNELIKFIKENKNDMSSGEIDKYFLNPRGTTKVACILYDINLNKKTQKSYTDKEIEFCKNYYSKYGLEYIAKNLNISITRARTLKSFLKLKRNYQYDVDIAKNIINDFKNSVPIYDISKKYDRSIHAIESFLSRRNITNPYNVCSKYYISSAERYMINYITNKLNISVPNKDDPKNRNYYWNVVDRYEIDLPLYINGYKFAIEYDGAKWHHNKINHDAKKDSILCKNGFIVFRITSADHNNNYYDLTSLNNKCDEIINNIKIITGSR